MGNEENRQRRLHQDKKYNNFKRSSPEVGQNLVACAKLASFQAVGVSEYGHEAHVQRNSPVYKEI